MLKSENTLLPTEDEIFANFQQTDNIVLTIVCLAFNHAKYIEQTLNGFLLQRTSFRYEIICHDDFSTDETRVILEKYKLTYPRLFHLIFPAENHFSKGRNPFIDNVLPHIRGRYIACCEGDDYWTDPNKLQLQLEFLEENEDFVVATHDVGLVSEENEVISQSCVIDCYKTDFSASDLKYGWAGPLTQAMVYRHIFLSYPPEFHKAHLGDVFLASLLGLHGKSKFIHQIQPSFYRIHDGGVFSNLKRSDKFDVQSSTFFWMYKYYKRVADWETAHVYKMKGLEKLCREISLVDYFKLFLVRFCGFNLSRLLKKKE